MTDERKTDDNSRENENTSIRIESDDDQCYDMSDCGESYSDPCCETFCCCCC